MRKINMLEKIIRWAKAQDEIHVVLLTSSHAIGNTATDQLSDYDITLFVSDLDRFTCSDEWLCSFEKILVYVPEKVVHFGQELPTRLVIYEDGTKVDFGFFTVGILEKILEDQILPEWLDIGYKVLIDKDSLTQNLRKPSFRAYIPKKPTEDEFKALVNEFWWETTYVAKNLWRDELLPAKYSSDTVIRYQLLLRMLEWYVQTYNKWECRTGVAGKGMKKLLDVDTWTQLTKTFAGADIEENWDALFKTTDIFRKIAIKVANDLDYEYLYTLDKKVTDYLYKIKNLEK